MKNRVNREDVVRDMENEKTQEGIRKEIRRIVIGQVILLAAMLAVYACIGRFSTAVLLGGVIGSACAVLNFCLLGRTVQRIASLPPENAELARMQMKSSYSTRMVVMLLVMVVCFALPFVDGLSAVIPLVFPRLTILFLQVTGKVKTM